jgi:hypothetical protein
MAQLLSDRWTHIYVLDTEFQASDGEQQIPVSVCAKGFRKARDIRQFLHNGDRDCPFVGVESDTTLFVGYNLAAEYKCFLALGWPMPKHSIDLYFEYRNLTCGVWRGKESLWEIGTGLEDAVRELGGNPDSYWKFNKTEMQKYIRRYGLFAPDGKLDTFICADKKSDYFGLPAYIDVDGKEHCSMPTIR